MIIWIVKKGIYVKSVLAFAAVLGTTTTTIVACPTATMQRTLIPIETTITAFVALRGVITVLKIFKNKQSESGKTSEP